MSSYCLFIVVSFLCLSVPSQSATNFIRANFAKCGCYVMCEKKYGVNNKPVSEQPVGTACRTGCRYYTVMSRQLTKGATTTEVSYCTKSCAKTYLTIDGRDACIDGCQNGCEFYRRPGVKVTIVVQDDPSIFINEQNILDPSYMEQKDAEIIDSLEKNRKTKLPASFFTNLPINREPKEPTGCCRPTATILGKEFVFFIVYIIVSSIGTLLVINILAKLRIKVYEYMHPSREGREHRGYEPLPQKEPDIIYQNEKICI